MTNARTRTEQSSHWYYKDGTPCYELPKKDGSGMKSPTLADAKKLNLMPSVTTILRLLDKPALNDWKIEQACLAVLTSKQKPGEGLDAFVHRTLHEEKVQEQEAQKARDVGIQVHDAIEKALNGQKYDKSLEHFVAPVLEWARSSGKVVWTEKILVGNGFAGRGDVLLENDTLKVLLLTDIKTCSKLPEKGSYTEHRLQTSAYASALGNTDDRRVITCNVYICTKKPEIAVFTQADWPQTFQNGFVPLLNYWQWVNNYSC